MNIAANCPTYFVAVVLVCASTFRIYTYQPSVKLSPHLKWTSAQHGGIEITKSNATPSHAIAIAEVPYSTISHAHTAEISGTTSKVTPVPPARLGASSVHISVKTTMRWGGQVQSTWLQ